MKTAAVMIVPILMLASCGAPKKPVTRKPPSTAVDTSRLDEAIQNAGKHQDAIITDGSSLATEIPEDERPPRIVTAAQETKTELAKADQTVADLKAKESASQEIDAEKTKQIEDLTAKVDELQAKLDSKSTWFFTLMIMGGALGIAVSIAVMVKLDAQIGGFGLILTTASLVLGFMLRDFGDWIPGLGVLAVIGGGVMFWRQHTKDQEAHKANDEVVRELVATTAEIQKKGWNQEVHDSLSSTISQPTRDRVDETRKRHKIDKVPLPPIPVAT